MNLQPCDQTCAANGGCAECTPCLGIYNLTSDEMEVLYDVSLNARAYADNHDICIDSRRLPAIVKQVAMKFQDKYCTQDWTQVEYLEVIDSFCDEHLPPIFEQEKD